MDWTQIIVAAITGLVTIVGSIIGNALVTKKDFLRLQIMSLIDNDRLNVLEHRPMVNRVYIDALFDKYRKIGGNSYIVDQVDKYHKEFDSYHGERK